MRYITTPTGGPSFSKQSETDPGSLWPVGPPETALQDVEVVNEINERAQNQAREVAQVVQDPEEARRTDAVEQLLKAAVAGKRWRESEISKRLQTMRTGTPEERAKLVREEIEKARDAQRKMLYSELNRLTHSILETNLQSLIKQFKDKKLTRNENEREETLRREALILSVSQIVTVWPSVGGNNDPKLCGYDALLIAAGPDNFKNFYNKTSSVRDALSVLLNGESLCDTIDTSLLCLEHEKLRDTNALTSYDVFDYLGQSVLGEWDVDNPGKRFLNVVHARRTTLKDVPKPPWGVWGDERTRVVCGKYVRVLEGLVRQVENLNWNKMAKEKYDFVTQEIEFSTWTTPKVNSKVRTGARLVEKWDGALAFEVVSFLWRAFHHSSVKSWDTNLNEVDKLPDIGDAPIGDATWESSFPPLSNPNFNEDDDEMQMGRSYLMRLLYTCYSHPKTKWFLRCPASVVLYTLLEQSAITEGFMTASMLDPKPKINEDDKATLAFKAARKYCFDTANGKTFKTSESMAIMINKHITNKKTTKLKRPKYPNRAHTKFLKGAFEAVNLGVLWKHPKLTKAFIGVIVISAGVWYFCGTTALAARIGGSTLSYAIENPLTNFVFNTLVKNPAEKALHQGTVEAVNAFFGRPGVAVFETGLGIWSYTHNGLVVLTERMAQAVGAPDNIADASASAGSGIVYLVASSAEPVSSTLYGPLGRIVRSAVSATPTNMTAGETIQEDETVQEYDVVGMEGEALLVLEAIRIGSNTDYDPCIPNDSPVTEVGHALSEMHSLSVAGWLVQNQTLADEEEEDLSQEMTDEAGKYLADVFEREDAVELAHALSNSTTRSGKVYKKAVLTRVAIPLSFPTGIDDESTIEPFEKRSKGTQSSLSQRLDIVAPLSALLIKK